MRCLRLKRGIELLDWSIKFAHSDEIMPYLEVASLYLDTECPSKESNKRGTGIPESCVMGHIGIKMLICE